MCAISLFFLESWDPGKQCPLDHCLLDGLWEGSGCLHAAPLLLLLLLLRKNNVCVKYITNLKLSFPSLLSSSPGHKHP